MSIDNELISEVRELIFNHRWAALATISGQLPFASMVAYAPYVPSSHLLFLLSQLSPHTQHLSKIADCSLVISQSDNGEDDPQTLSRLTLTGRVKVISRDSDEFESAKQCYCHCLPASERLFGFGDFLLFKFSPDKARFIGGFGRAHNVKIEQIRASFEMHGKNRG